MNDFMRLFKRKSKYYVEFHRGKAKSLQTSNLEEAKAIFREMKKEYLKGKLIQLDSVRRMTLSDFRDAYLKSRIGMSPMTVKKDESVLRLFIDALGASQQMATISSKKIEDFKRICLARGATPHGINSYLRHIKAALSWACEDKIIETRPKIKMVPANDELPRVLTPEQIKTILEKAKEKDIWFWRYLTFLLWTGARRREALNIEWQNINLSKCNCLLTKTKGKKDRVVPLLPAVIDALEPVKKDLGRVFPQLHADTYTHQFKIYARECGTNARLHDVRHSAVTYMLKSGIPIQVVKEIVGHSQLSTTMIYTHVLDDIKQTEMQKMKIE